jgi:hypothetical protein
MSANAPASASRKRPVVPLAKDADVVLKRVRKLRDELVRKAEVNISAADEKPLPIGVPSDILEVAELSNAQVIEGMEAIATRIATQVLHKRGLSLEVPSRASSNQIYVKDWDRIVLGGKKSTRSFLNVREARKTAVTIRVMQLLHTGTLIIRLWLYAGTLSRSYSVVLESLLLFHSFTTAFVSPDQTYSHHQTRFILHRC